jgi:hypothetical protein
VADPAYVIVVDGIDNTQRTLMHSWVKSVTDNWWHQLPDVWIVLGREPGYWRDGLQPFAMDATKILVLALKETRGHRWATHRVPSAEWFGEHFPGSGT